MSRWFIALGGLVLVGLIASLAFPTIIWDGVVTREILLHLRDQDSNEPIPEAEVRYLSARDETFRESLSGSDFQEYLQHSGKVGISDAKGVTCLKVTFGAGGGTFMGFPTGRYVVSGKVEISHPDYEPLTQPLESAVARTKLPLTTRFVEITLLLQRRAQVTE